MAARALAEGNGERASSADARCRQAISAPIGTAVQGPRGPASGSGSRRWCLWRPAAAPCQPFLTSCPISVDADCIWGGVPDMMTNSV